jgi:penicillin-binding protein 1C
MHWRNHWPHRGNGATLHSPSFLQTKKPSAELINTNIDLNTQLKTEKLVEDYGERRLRNIKNAAVVIIDNKTHKLLPMSGHRL